MCILCEIRYRGISIMILDVHVLYLTIDALIREYLLSFLQKM